jgi:hypothetical protein
MKFSTKLSYSDRKSKAGYVFSKYQSILHGSILDVGADERYLKPYLPGDASYTGIGLGGSPDIRVDLEKEKIPTDDASVDCVLCLDVLEHIDKVHVAFDELCRVSRNYIIISLPNPWRDFFNAMRGHHYRPGQPIKFYGFPVDPPDDRHRWFFSPAEADGFVVERGKRNGFELLQVDREIADDGLSPAQRLKRRVGRTFFSQLGIDFTPLATGTNWYVLRRSAQIPG